MPNYDLEEYHQVFPPKVGVILRIDCTHTEAQAIKNAPGLPEVAAALAFELGGPIGSAIVAGLVYALQGEIGEKDSGNGVIVAIDKRVFPLPTTSVSVHTKDTPAPGPPPVEIPQSSSNSVETGLRGLGNRGADRR